MGSGSKGGSSPSGNTTTSVQPWAQQQPYLLQGFEAAKNLYENNTPQYFPGATYEPENSWQRYGLGQVVNQALSDPLASTAATNNAQLASGGYLYWNPAYQTQSTLATTNFGDLNPATPTLNSLSAYNVGASNPSTQLFDWLANSNLGANNLGTNTLVGAAGSSPLEGGPAVRSLSDLSSNNLLNGSRASSTLDLLASGNPLGGSVTQNALTDLTGAANPIASNLAGYLSGENLAAGNPNTSALASSVLSSVVPRIESQFIAGGMLPSAEAARATSAGATAALAPSLFQQYQQEEANQINAANALAASRNTAANNLGNLALGGYGLQNTAANNLGNQILASGALRGTSANNLGNLLLGGTGQQINAAGLLGTQAIQGGNLQNLATQGLSNSILQGLGLQTTAAQDLASNYLKGWELQNTAANNLGTTFESGMNDMLRGLALAPQTDQLLYSPAQTILGAGTTQQTLDQQAINDLVQRWNYGQTVPFNSLNQYLASVGGTGYGSQTTNPYFANSPSTNLLGGAVAGGTLGNLLFPAAAGATSYGALGGAGLGALFGLLSDRRAKDDIEPVGELDNGLTVYSYRYRGEPEAMRHIGLMADEVEKDHPEAVKVLPGFFGNLAGYKTVDYAKAVE